MHQEFHDFTAASAMRRLAQAVQSLDAETPRIEIGSSEQLHAIETELGRKFPNQIRSVYLDSNPVALSVPMPVEDVEFIPMAELAQSDSELDVGASHIPFAREGEILYAVDIESETVVSGTRSSSGWEWEPIASKLSHFLGALAAVAETFASMSGETLANKFELDPEAQISLEEDLQTIDPRFVDRWMEWLG